MLKNKVSIFILLGVLIAIAIGIQFIDKDKKTVNKIIKAVPKDAAIIIEVNNFSELIYKFSRQNLIKKEFESLVSFKSFFDKINYLDSTFAKERIIKNIFTDNNIIISSHFSGKNSNEILLLVTIKKGTDADELRKFISKKISKIGSIKQRSYEDINVFDVEFYKDEDKQNNFYYYFVDNSFIFSFSKILLEKSARKIKSKSSILSDKAFKTLSATIGKNVDANIYINYNYFPKVSLNLIDLKYQSSIEFFNNFASWSAFDLKLKKDAILLSGFTYADDSLNQYLSIFNNQDPVDNEFIEILPNNTSTFVAFNFSDINEWKKSYIKYLRKYGNYNKFKNKKNIYNTNIKDLFYNNIEGNACISWVNKSVSEGTNDIVGIFQLSDTESFTEEMNTLVTKSDSLNRLIRKRNIIDAKEDIAIKQFLIPDVFSQLLGKIFSNLDASFYLIVDDYIVFAKSQAVLKSFYEKYKSGNSLKNDIDYQNFSKSISSESNIFIYSNFSYSKSIINNLLNNNSKIIYKKNIKKINKLQAFTLQFSSSKNLMFSSIYLNYNPLHKRENKHIWETKLNSTLYKKPQIVINHNTRNNEVVFQDVNNNLYLVGETGKILWTKKLNEKILGKIHQIDFYKNNKLQLMFNTKNHIYLIDRNGEKVENYPIKIKSPATNPIAIFDYDNNKNYRILVACENKEVYLLDKFANKIEGWVFTQTKTHVKQPAQHFVNDNKDYIIFSDNKKTYIVNRRGKLRVKPEYDFERSKNSKFYFEKGKSKKDARFVCTDNKGVAHFIFTDGTIKKMVLGNFSANHNFGYVDLLGSGAKYFVYTDNKKLKVFNRDKSLRFEQEFNTSIKNSLSFYKFNKGIKYIGVSEKNKNKIYLFNPNGKLVKGFPMNGCSPFTITSINKKSKLLNLIVGSSNKYLYNYSFLKN